LIDSPAEVTAVVTNPDRPAGRGMELQAPPVKRAAQAVGIEVLQPARARDEEFHEQIRALASDVAVVVAYGKILPGSLLEIPRKGFVNVHFSLLPAYRGAAPVQHAIIDGRDETGISIMVLTEGMDEGPVLAEEPVPISPDDTAGSLGERMAVIGARRLVPALEGYVVGGVQPVEQDHDRATYAPKLDTDDARIDWSEPAARIRNLVRGLNPTPGAWTMLGDARLKVYAVGVGDDAGMKPGELGVDGDRLLVGTGDAAMSLAEVQIAGKKRMGGAELARGLRLAGGEGLQ
jgi:methionyl-tRNA formyltransferase